MLYRNFEIPATWRIQSLGEVSHIVSGATPKTGVSENWGGDIPWITPDDLSKNRNKVVSGGSRFLTSVGYASCSTRLVPTGSVLFTSRAPIGYVAIAGRDLCTNQGFKTAVPCGDVNSEFLYYQLQYLTPEIKSRASGTTFLEINGKGFAATQVLVPPLAEQQRIVEILEEQFSRLDAALVSIRTVREKAAKFPLSVIAEVINAKSTEARTKRLLDAFVLQRGFDLPKHSRLSGSVPVVTSSGVTTTHSVAKVHAPGVVTGRSGTIGFVQYVETDFWPLNTTLYVKDFKGNNPRFVYYLLQTVQLKRFAGGSTVPSLDRNTLSDIPLRIPDIDDQQEIVEALDSILPSLEFVYPILNRLEMRIASARRSLLHSAFAGTLTAQWRENHHG